VTHYRRKFFFQTGFGGYTYVPLRGSQEAISKLVSDVSLRLSAQEYLKLPPLLVTDHPVQIGEQAMRSYRQVESDFFAALGDAEVIAPTAAAASIKCRQVANGAVYADEPNLSQRRVVQVHTAKAEMLESLIEENAGNPVLVAFEFKHDLTSIRTQLGQDVPSIDGDTPAKLSDLLVQRWNAGELPILAVHPATAAHGLNLQYGGETLVWYSITWDLEHYEQLVRRLWRSGQTRPVNVHRIIAADTIDCAVIDALDNKAQTQNRLLAAIQSYRHKTV
jgi:SNF2 family DNA or RNA helicase